MLGLIKAQPKPTDLRELQKGLSLSEYAEFGVMKAKWYTNHEFAAREIKQAVGGDLLTIYSDYSIVVTPHGESIFVTE